MRFLLMLKIELTAGGKMDRRGRRKEKHGEEDDGELSVADDDLPSHLVRIGGTCVGQQRVKSFFLVEEFPQGQQVGRRGDASC